MASCSQKACPFPASKGELCAHHAEMFREPVAEKRNAAQGTLTTPIIQVGFKPRITIETCPADELPHDLWTWHMPNGKKNYHGMVGLIRLNVGRYVKNLERYGVFVKESEVDHPPDPMGPEPKEPRKPKKIRRVPEMTATKRVEERIETRVTESTVRMSESDQSEPPPVITPVIEEPKQAWLRATTWEGKLLEKFPSLDPTWPDELQTFWFHAMDRLQGIGVDVARKPLDLANLPPRGVVVAPTPRPDSYLPPDGEDAKRVLDLHEKLSLIDMEEMCGDWENVHAELWDISDGIAQYRQAKTITDAILKPWLDEQFEFDIFDEEAYGGTWSDLWKRVHGALHREIAEAAERQQKAVTKEYHSATKEENLKHDEREFLNLALKFFAEEDKLTEDEWKQINDKKLPEMAKAILKR